MVDSARPEPQRTEEARRAEVGAPQERSERQRLADERPDYDARQARIREERKPMGPPLAEGEDRPLRAFESEDDEPPVDPD